MAVELVEPDAIAPPDDPLGSGLRVADDRMSVILSCGVPAGDVTEFARHIEGRLAALGLKGAVERNALVETLRTAQAKGEPLVDEVLVAGTLPVPATDGHIQWQGDFFNNGFVTDEQTGTVDYRHHAAQLSVEEDQLLAIAVMPREGVPGVDVLGNRVPVRRPRRPYIQLGQNVRREEAADTIRFHAGTAGRLRWAGHTLSVDTEYHIKGDVGLSTGNIDHPGAVVVYGDVCEGAEIRAEGDIEVHGIIECADVRTNGSLLVAGGIMGMRDHAIKVAGKIKAKYILEANVDAGGDVEVLSEVVQSTVRTQGALHVSRGRIVGGEVTALGGVIATEIGGAAGVRTVVTVAKDYELAELLEDGLDRTLSLDEELRQVEAALADVHGHEQELTGAQRIAFRKLRAMASAMGTELDSLGPRVRELLAAYRSRVQPLIEVRRRVFPDAVLGVKNHRLHVKEEIVGPARVEVVRGGLQLVSMPKSERVERRTPHRTSAMNADM